jgi:hypothetical protein
MFINANIIQISLSKERSRMAHKNEHFLLKAYSGKMLINDIPSLPCTRNSKILNFAGTAKTVLTFD